MACRQFIGSVIHAEPSRSFMDVVDNVAIAQTRAPSMPGQALLLAKEQQIQIHLILERFIKMNDVDTAHSSRFTPSRFCTLIYMHYNRFNIVDKRIIQVMKWDYDMF